MIVPENFNGDVKALPALSPNEIKTILKRNFYWASTIKTPFLTGVQVEMLIRELKKSISNEVAEGGEISNALTDYYQYNGNNVEFCVEIVKQEAADGQGEAADYMVILPKT